MNEPHENLDHDPFANGAQRRRSRLRRTVARRAHLASRARCAAATPSPLGLRGRQDRPCPRADRDALR